MRIKFLSVIVSFLLVSFAITSCLDNNEATGDYSTDATIHAFAIDTIFGVDYKFTINQIGEGGIAQIYNLDSLPVGSDTIIDRILITTLTTNSNIVTMVNKTGEDSIINIADSMDLRKPLNVKVWSPEGYVMLSQGASEIEYKKFVKNYRIEVRVHKQDPDTLNWGSPKDEMPIATNFSKGGQAITGPLKAVILKKGTTTEEIFVYSKSSSNALIAYKANTLNGSEWQDVSSSITGLPATVDLSSFLQFGDYLYTVADNKVYFSQNGIEWRINPLLNRNGYTIHTLLASYAPSEGNNLINITTGIAAIVSDNSKAYFAISDANAASWKLGEEVPEGFPNYDISSTVYITDIGVQGAMLMGSEKKREETETKTPIVPWGSYDGTSWADLSTVNAFCPILTLPSIFRYGTDFYAFGNDFKIFHTSKAGIAWYEADKKFYFPAGLTARAGSNYSMVVDSRNFIWIICAKSGNNTDDVWRARLNKLGFKNALTQ